MCWAGKHFEIPTGIKKGDKATAIATKITARATSFVFMSCLLFFASDDDLIRGNSIKKQKPLPQGNGFFQKTR
jgi:hypothetical protein